MFQSFNNCAKALNPGEMRDDQEVMLRCGLGEKNGLAQVVQKGRMPPSLVPVLKLQPGSLAKRAEYVDDSA